MLNGNLFETREQAGQICSGDEAIIQVEGGYALMSWEQATLHMEAEAESLLLRGYHSYQIDDMIAAFGFDRAHAESLSEIMADMEEGLR